MNYMPPYRNDHRPSTFQILTLPVQRSRHLSAGAKTMIQGTYPQFVNIKKKKDTFPYRPPEGGSVLLFTDESSADLE